MSDREIWEVAPGGHEHGRRWSITVLAAVVALAAVAAAATFLVTRRSQASKVAVSAAEEDALTRSGTKGARTLTVPASEPQPLVDPDDIISGGPPPDGIPPIDDPKFDDVEEVDWLAPEEPVVAVEIDGDARAYPLQIMTWHEIVNDTVGRLPVTVTFCPLCNTPYAFVRPKVDGELTSFGTSGKLYNSNLVMYDRATESLWPQALGQAVMGPLTGASLERVPAQIVSWEEFRAGFPTGRVLSRDTGHDRDYGNNPYPGYDDVDNQPFLFTGEVDGRLAAVERILGVEMRDEIVAFPYFRLREAAVGEVAVINTTIGDHPVVVIWKGGTRSALDKDEIALSKDVGQVAAYSRRLEGRVLSFAAIGGQIRDQQTLSEWNVFGKGVSGRLQRKELKPLDYHDSFWFDWAAFHPETAIWPGS